MDDIIVLNKGTFVHHMEQLRIFFSRIRKVSLKINAKKCSFGLKEIPYLGYFITSEGVNPNPNKIQGIMDLQISKKSPTEEILSVWSNTIRKCRSVAHTSWHA